MRYSDFVWIVMGLSFIRIGISMWRLSRETIVNFYLGPPFQMECKIISVCLFIAGVGCLGIPFFVHIRYGDWLCR
jgi:hypothetical protein